MLSRFIIGTAIVLFLIFCWVVAVQVTGNLSQYLSDMLP